MSVNHSTRCFSLIRAGWKREFGAILPERAGVKALARCDGAGNGCLTRATDRSCRACRPACDSKLNNSVCDTMSLMPIFAVLGFMGFLLCAQTSPATKLLHEAEEKIQAERFDLAEGLLEQAVHQAPTNTDALYRLAYVQYRRRKLALARSSFAAVLKLAPPAHNSRYFLARISLLENKPREAVHWLEPVVTSGGSSFDAASQLAKAYASAGEFSKAIGPLRPQQSVLASGHGRLRDWSTGKANPGRPPRRLRTPPRSLGTDESEPGHKSTLGGGAVSTEIHFSTASSRIGAW
jgi:hypothetical protein